MPTTRSAVRPTPQNAECKCKCSVVIPCPVKRPVSSCDHHQGYPDVRLHARQYMLQLNVAVANKPAPATTSLVQREGRPNATKSEEGKKQK
jgi:hypothetical protein